MFSLSEGAAMTASGLVLTDVLSKEEILNKDLTEYATTLMEDWTRDQLRELVLDIAEALEVSYLEGKKESR